MRTSRRQRSTRLRRSACNRRTSRPSTAAARAHRLPSSPAAGRRTSAGAPPFTSATRHSTGTSTLRKQQCGQGDRLTCEPSLYRFDNVAWTLGGPVLLPWTQFNRQRNRLFFFWSQEVLARTDPGTLNLRRMPTARERAGDFSETLNSQGLLLNIRDPMRSGGCNQTGPPGPACFPGNVIPANRIDPTGQALLNLFPLPNATDPSGDIQLHLSDGD